MKMEQLQGDQHLHPEVRKIVDYDDADRIKHIYCDKWIGYSRAKQGLDALQELFEFPVRNRMPNLLIVGATNNGKSMILEKFKRVMQAEITENDVETDAENIPIVSMQMPSDPTINRFYLMLLHAMNATANPRAKKSDIEYVALKVLKRTGVRILIIDEIHNLLAGKEGRQREFLNLLRFLGNELQIPIVAAGTRDAYLAIRSDPQLENRFHPFILPDWNCDSELASFLSGYLSLVPLKRPTEISRGLMEYVLAKSEGTIGEITSLLTKASVVAIETGEEKISRNVLSLTPYHSPSERRKLFERELIN